MVLHSYVESINAAGLSNSVGARKTGRVERSSLDPSVQSLTAIGWLMKNSRHGPNVKVVLVLCRGLQENYSQKCTFRKCALMQRINSHKWYDDVIFILFHETWTEWAQGKPILLTSSYY